MCRARPILGFLCRFVIVFGLLVAPWPGWPETYALCLQKSATTIFGAYGSKSIITIDYGKGNQPLKVVFGSFSSKGIVAFTRNPAGEKRVNTVLDTIIYVGNREQAMDVIHGGPTAAINFSSRTMVYLPTALVIALILATGIGWRRRLCALVWGLVWIHVFTVFLLGLMIVMIICAHPELGLFEVSPFWQKVVSLLYEFFFVRFGALSATAVLIWIIVTFRRDDWIKILGQKKADAGQRWKSPTTRNAR